MDYDNDGEAMQEHRSQQHYYGDTARVLFILAAVLILVATTTGAHLPLTSSDAVITSIILVIAGGITNPAQGWIHWINAAISAVGVFVFGLSAINNYQAGASLTDPSYLYTEVIAVLSLLALYYTTKTVRGRMLKTTLA